MYKALFISTGFLLLLGTPAFAMTPQAHSDQSQTVAKSGTGSQKMLRHRRHDIAMKTSQQGDKEVNALNALESAGYRQFDDLHVQGNNFVANAIRGGKSYNVKVSPSGKIQASNA